MIRSKMSEWATQAVDVLTDKESLALLAEWSAQTDLPPAASETARQCGNLPLALALAGACVRDGSSWKDLVEGLRSAELEFLGRPHGSILKALKVSLDALDPEIARRYIDLGVLPEGESVAEAGIISLWARSAGFLEDDARKTVAVLAHKGLLRVEGNEPNKRISIHPFLHDYLRIGQADLQRAHLLMLEAYREKCANGWASGPDDGYFFEHVLHHLAGAGLEEQVHSLFASRPSHAGLAWFDVHRHIGKLNLFIKDIGYGWRLAEGQSIRQLEGRQGATSVGVELRYALIRASINTFAADLSPKQLASLVSSKEWSIEQSLAYVRQIPEMEQRLTALIEVAFQVPEERRAEIVHAVIDEASSKSMGSQAHEIVIRLVDLGFAREALQLARADARWRSHHLVKLGPRLTEPLKTEVLLEALEAVLTVTDPSVRAWHLAELVPHLPENAREIAINEGLKAARAIDANEISGYAAVDTVASLARFIPYFEGYAQADLVAEMTTKLEAISVREDRSRAIADSLAYLSAPLQTKLLHEGMTIARSLADPKERFWQLGWLLPHVDESSRHAVLDDAIKAATAILQEDERAQAIAHLAPFIPLEIARDFAKILAKGHNDRSLGWALSQIALRFATLGCPDEALSTARSIRDQGHRRATLGRLAEIAGAQFPDLSEAVSPIHDEKHRAKAIVGFAGYLSTDAMRYALQTIDVLPTWSPSSFEYNQTQALTELAPRLPEALVPLSLDIAVSLPEHALGSTPRLAVLVALVPRANCAVLLDKALFVARSFRTQHLRARALITLIPRMSGSMKVMVLEEAEHVARAIKRKPYRAQILGELAVLSPESKKPALTRDALADALRIENQYQRAKTLANLGPNLPRDLLPEALTAALQISDGRASAVAAIAPRLGEPESTLVMRDVMLQAAATYMYVGLAEVFARAPEMLLDEARAIALNVTGEWHRANALLALAIRFGELRRYDEALDLVQQIPYTGMSGPERASALEKLAPDLPRHLVPKALSIAANMSPERAAHYRCRALAAIAIRATEAERVSVLQTCLKVVREIEAEDIREELWSPVVHLMVSTAPRACYPLYSETIHSLANRTRSQLFTDLYALRSVIFALGGEQAADLAYRAVRDVTDLFP